jgi:hypothetical protein
MRNYLGVKFFIKEPHPYEFEHMEGIDMLDYDYFFKVRPVDSWQGNGYKEVDIFTNGENKVIEVGDWKIVPVAKMARIS